MEYNNAASNLANPDKETIMEIAKVTPQIDEVSLLVTPTC
ncbi:unnamed protein product, partial [Cuscuta epithymum]